MDVRPPFFGASASKNGGHASEHGGVGPGNGREFRPKKGHGSAITWKRIMERGAKNGGKPLQRRRSVPALAATPRALPLRPHVITQYRTSRSALVAVARSVPSSVVQSPIRYISTGHRVARL
eukprot:2706845-Rhodomonas_salina.2